MILTNATLATMDNQTYEGRPYGQIPNGAIVVENGVVSWVGKAVDLPAHYTHIEMIDLGGRLVTPALIDCHTHLVYGGNRANEFEMRLNGAGYEEIARAGGGIMSTVTATRQADDDTLISMALPRLDSLLAEGVTSIEIKSGYGLDGDTELRMLRVARRLATLRAVRIKTSFLGAHAVPADFTGDADSYIDDICIPALMSAHAEGLVDAVDGFCEGIAFTPDQIERVFLAATDLGLPIKLHAEQLSRLGGTQIAARYGALSADHVEYADEDDARALAAANTVAVLLPGAFYTLRETQKPPIQHFRNHGVPMALASDANPGSSPLTSLLLTMNMASTLFHMTPEESLAGVTRHAATALGLRDCGMIAGGLRADLAIWDVEQPAELSYRIGFNPLYRRIFGGAL